MGPKTTNHEPLAKTAAAERQSRLNDVLLAYAEAVDAGSAPDRDQLIAQHRDLADDLRAFFAGQDQVNQFAQSLRLPTGEPAAGLTPLGEIGDFRLLREIGRGGMGVVYEAEQLSLHRRVALKVLPFAAALDPRQLQRFRVEAQAAAQLHHTSIVPVFAVGSERGVHYYAMQFIEGQSLAALIQALKQAGPSPSGVLSSSAKSSISHSGTSASLSTAHTMRPREFCAGVARLGRQAAEALEHAHQMGIVHRDIKPGNLLLDERGQLWVADFGLAQFRTDAELTASGEVLGTLRYTSPEQARARPGVVDQRSDIYSLGATMYELLTLRPVFDGRDRSELLRQIAFDEPTPPCAVNKNIPYELETIVLKALSKTPSERYQSAKELADDLQRFLDDKPILARRPSWTERAAKWARRHRPVVASAVMLLVLSILALSVSTFLIAQAYNRERQKSEEARVARLRAEENFQRAKRAVDLLTKLSEEELGGLPWVDAVRRKMLDAALAYYEEFLVLHYDDPVLTPELEVSHARVTRLLAELSAIQGYAQMQLLANPRVQDAISATPLQRKQIHDLNHKMAEQWRELSRKESDLTAEQRHTRLADFARDREKDFASLLSSQQIKRLQQVSLHWRNQFPYAFRDPEIVAALQLTAKQQDDIRGLQERFGLPPFGPGPKKFFDSPPPGKKDGKGPDGGKKDGGYGKKGPPPPGPYFDSKKIHQELLDVLTIEQKTRWREMTGDPVDFGPIGPIGPMGPPPIKGK